MLSTRKVAKNLPIITSTLLHPPIINYYSTTCIRIYKDDSFINNSNSNNNNNNNNNINKTQDQQKQDINSYITKMESYIHLNTSDGAEQIELLLNELHNHQEELEPNTSIYQYIQYSIKSMGTKT